MEKILLKKHLTFKPTRPGGGTCHLEITLKESSTKCTHWDTLNEVENPILLSICGVSRGGRGQCVDAIKSKIDNFKKKDKEALTRIIDIWESYHLNDLKAGTKYQTELISNLEYLAGEDRYEKQCSYLQSKNALEDRGYKYGHGWLYRDIPVEVIEFLESL